MTDFADKIDVFIKEIIETVLDDIPQSKKIQFRKFIYKLTEINPIKVKDYLNWVSFRISVITEKPLCIDCPRYKDKTCPVDQGWGCIFGSYQP